MIADRNFPFDIMNAFLSEVDDYFEVPLSMQVKNAGSSLSEHANKLAQKATVVYDTAEDGDIKGLVVGYMHDTPDNGSYITLVAVKNAYRKQGLFRKLYAEYEGYAKKMGLSHISLTTRATNLSAQKAYESVGFTKVSLAPEGKKDLLKYHKEI